MVEFDDKGEVLANFLGSHYYQTSELDWDDHLSPILHVKSTEGPGYIDLLRDRMIRLSQMELTENKLQATFLSLGADYVPMSGGSASGWLSRAIKELTR